MVEDMKKILYILIMGIFLVGNSFVFAECLPESNFNNPGDYFAYLASEDWEGCLKEIEAEQKKLSCECSTDTPGECKIW